MRFFKNGTKMRNRDKVPPVNVFSIGCYSNILSQKSRFYGERITSLFRDK